MMPREDGRVINPQLKVYSTANIRVLDASVFYAARKHPSNSACCYGDGSGYHQAEPGMRTGYEV